MDVPRFTDKTRAFLMLQDELRTGIPTDSSTLCASEEEAMAELSAYFENPDRLARAFDFCALRYEHAFLQRHQASPWVDGTIRLMLKEFREVRNCNLALCFQTWGSYMEAVNRGMRSISVVGYMQRDVDELGTEFAVRSILRDVGDILEVSLQPLARLRLAMHDVANIRTGGSQPVAEMTFGDVIAELASSAPVGDIYRTWPCGILISQWRNIANHNSYMVTGDEVICTYGRPGRYRQFSCSIADLIEVTRYTDTLYFLHKVAFEVFGIDNLKEMAPYAPQLEISEYSKDAVLVHGLVEAGFLVERAGYGQETWRLLLIDECGREPDEVKAVLQDAVKPYFMLSGSTQFFALVKSGTSSVRVGFRVSRA